MMASTHALLGMVLGGTVLFWHPEMLFAVGLVSFIGGFFPDLDVPFNRGKTFHYPIQFFFVAAVASVYAILSPGIYTVSAFYFVLTAAIHSASDVLGGGLGAKPRKMSSNKAVYDHFNEKWQKPRHYIRYDGSPEDFMLTFFLGITCLAIYRPQFEELIVATVLISGVYTIFRKKLVGWATGRFL